MHHARFHFHAQNLQKIMRVTCLLQRVALQMSSTALSSVHKNTNITFPVDADCQAPSRKTVLTNSPTCLRSPIRISKESAHTKKLELANAKLF